MRQLAFMLLQRVAGQPATLYREAEEDEEYERDVKEPSASLKTGAPPQAAATHGRSQRPQVSGEGHM